MVKLQRNYILSIQPNINVTAQIPISITLPITIDFDIQRNSLASTNVAAIRIYNLNPTLRNQLARDWNDFGDFQSVVLKAGYGNSLSVIFAGNVLFCRSFREGTDYITQIEAFDGGTAYAQPKSDFTYPAGTSRSAVIETLTADLAKTGVSVGKIGTFDGVYEKGGAVSGNTVELLKTETNNGVFIDNNTVNCLNSNECLPGGSITVNSDSSLLGTPLRERTQLSFDILFEPKLAVGQQITLQGQSDNFSGTYRVVGLKHRGMISPAVCGDAITTVTCFIGSALNGGALKVVL